MHRCVPLGGMFWATIAGLVVTTALSILLLTATYTHQTFGGISSFVPAAFWAGAITPVPTTETLNRNFSIPYYSPDPNGRYWNKTVGVSVQNISRSSLGSFSYSPVRTIMGSMLDNAAYAVAPNTSTQIYRKLDNTGYTFQGRSYGVGASVGLVEMPQQDGLLNYTLVESGFMANVTCWYNRITTFHVSPRPGYAWYWQGCGHISSGDHECYSVPGYDDSEVVILAGDPYRGQNEWGIATGQGATGALPNRSKHFNPSMDALSLGADKLQFNVVQQIGAVAQTSCSSHSNIANTQAAQSNGFAPTDLNEEEINLLGIQTSLEVLVDAILVGFASAQFDIDPNGTLPIVMNATYAAIKLGDERFVVLTSVINLTTVLPFLVIGLFFLLRDGGESTTEFDYNDLENLIIGISLRGVENAVTVNRKLRKEGTVWTGHSSADVKLGKLEVLLENKDRAAGLILSEKNQIMEQELVNFESLVKER
ncbi:MAG: hypothetical protein MMC33_008080 [Icmadophila ericetorum]|nr:hypothetical protein [Icmadophila ericetorum]